jgi:hypothetical protein
LGAAGRDTFASQAEAVEVLHEVGILGHSPKQVN